MTIRVSTGKSIALAAIACLLAGTAAAQEKRSVEYKVISTTDFIRFANPHPGERLRVEILMDKPDQARSINGAFSAIPPGVPGVKVEYHYHQNRESIIQILSGDAIEMINGKAVPLKPGDVIYIAPGTRHAMINNSVINEVKYMEFYSPTAPDTVQVKD